ncbi:MAG: stage II sporulation protein M [Oligoflexia bacterium]|nr:stage II sporulation protein M [Oligoflexia bacterium]
MHQDHFVQRHQAEWTDLGRRLDGVDAKTWADLPGACRRVSQHLALARTRGYSADLVARLHDLAIRSHQQLYQQPVDLGTRLVALVKDRVPAAVRAEWVLVGLAHLLFYGPLFVTLIAVHHDPHVVYSVLDMQTVSDMETMYDPAGTHYLRERAVDSDLLMFGYYIWNNIGIGFRTFASGALLGLGPVWFLASNGVTIGAVYGHLLNIGYGGPLTAFTVGHSSFELTAIVLSGAAGARLGLAWLNPGQWTRTEALGRAARRALPIIEGATLMLLVAAVLEAFWSSSQVVPAALKYTVGAGLWVLVYGWLLLGGRRADR